jgi:ribonucleotide monophosphatase NagD (HAD superfamily)
MAANRYVFDIDGVICTQEKCYANAEPFPEMIHLINKLYEAGNYIIYYTARGTLSGYDWRIETLKQFESWGVKYHELVFGKPAGDYYIDDRNLSIKEFVRGARCGNDSRDRN